MRFAHGVCLRLSTATHNCLKIETLVTLEVILVSRFADNISPVKE